MNDELRTGRDGLSYRSLPLRQAHPDHLATVASLFGLDDARCHALPRPRDRLRSMAADLTSDRRETFRLDGGRVVEVSHRVGKATLTVLAEHWPLAMGFDELHRQSAALLGPESGAAPAQRELLASDLMRLGLAGAVELHRATAPFVLVAGARPGASAIARRDAARGAPSASLRHEPVV
ncbi:MAG: hypothetical protein ACREYB_10300, partial [Casimicrobiaceae bacterium]